MKFLCKIKKECEDANIELMEDCIKFHFDREHGELNLKKLGEMKQLLTIKRPPNLNSSMPQLGDIHFLFLVFINTTFCVDKPCDMEIFTDGKWSFCFENFAWISPLPKLINAWLPDELTEYWKSSNRPIIVAGLPGTGKCLGKVSF